MPLIGAHLPTKGELVTAIDAAQRLGCEVVQLFVKPPIQWAALPLSDAVIFNFTNARQRSNLAMVIAHAGYLVNLASPRPDVLLQSRKSLLDEMQRCHLLGINYLVVHAGAHLGIGEKRGIKRMQESLHWLFDRLPDLPFPVTLLIENTAGQGTCLGYNLAQLAEIVGDLAPEKVGICLDTCHLFVAGYELRTREGLEELFRQIDENLGWERIKLLHANDSLYPIGSRVDRHWHIGEGQIGLDGFISLLNHPKFVQIPTVIETPEPETHHSENLTKLRSVIMQKDNL
ncbi:MAG: deoxyribonuclease IV [Armatimonadetes bacterium]|nr:deoxyribonuclease IV [Armatimonadota bacterium]MDW8028194.1 deoxyribonuclease IV [Armatimonadota bacterium]